MTEPVSLYQDVEGPVHAGLISPVQFIGKAVDRPALIAEDIAIVAGQFPSGIFLSLGLIIDA